MRQQEHEGHRDRMRARFAQGGLAGFAPHETLELLLFYAIPRQNVNPLAHRLLSRFGSVDAVLRAGADELAQVPGVGAHTAALLTLVPELARYAERERKSARAIITNYREAKAHCAGLFGARPQEALYVISLDIQGRVLHDSQAAAGTLDAIPIYPRTVVACAMRHNAHAVVLAHNHPGGVAEPSDADIRVTDILSDALAAVDIRLMDHIVCADGECVSLAQWRRARSAPPAGRDREDDPYGQTEGHEQLEPK